MDKVCIDQVNIADGLRVLPVNVMAAKKLLVLYDETYSRLYPHRLWCAWELFTLLAFTSLEVERIELAPFAISGMDNDAERLKQFGVRVAHCYDPNEEARLLRINWRLGPGTLQQPHSLSR